MHEVEAQVLRNIPDVVLRFGADGLLDWASPSLEHVFGYVPAEVVGTEFRPCDPGDYEQLLISLGEAVEARAPGGSWRFPAYKADGTAVLVDLSARFEYDDEGGLEHMVAVMRELAERGVPDNFLQILADNTSDVVLVLDPAMEVLWASPSTRKVLGHRPTHLVGSARQIIPADDVDSIREQLDAAVREQAATRRTRMRMLRSDGSPVWMDVSASLVWKDTTLEYIVASLRDIDEQVRMEEALRDSVTRYQILVENAHDVVYRVDARGRVEWIAPNITALAGWDPADVVGRHRRDFVHPDDARVAEQARVAAASGHPATVEVRLLTADGRHRWVEISNAVVQDESGSAIAGVGVIRDVHERHQAQAALAASEQMFRSAMRDSAIGMCLVTPEGRITEPNPALCEFLARSAAQLATFTWQELEDPAEVEQDLHLLEGLLAGRTGAVRGIRHYILPDGTRVAGDVTLSTILDARGVVTGFVAQIVAVTEQLRMQEQLTASEEHYRLLADSVSDVVVRADNDGVLVWASRSLTPATGWQAGDVTGRHFLDLVHPNDVETVAREQAGLLRGESAAYEVRILTSEGEYRWFALSVNPLRDRHGGVTGQVGTWRDISGEVATRRLLAQREAEFREIAEHAADVVLRLDASDEITWASASTRDVMGYVSRDFLGLDPKVFVHPDDLSRYREFAHNLQPDIPARITLRARCADGQYRWFAVIATLIFGPDGELVSQIIGMRNIDGEVRAVEALARSEEQFRLAMTSAPSGMAVVDLSGRFEQVNESLAAMVGQDREWLLRHSLRDIVHPDDWPRVLVSHDRLIAGWLPAAMEEIRLVHDDGATVWVQSSLAVLREEDGPPLSFVAQFIDVTEAREARDALRHAATHDPLTMLGNRRGLSESLEQVLSHTPRTGTLIGILALDLDGLKPVNDRYGHAAGDEVLVTVGQRLRATVRKDDPIARMGGDEFVVLLVAVHTQEQVVEIAEKIRDALGREIPLGEGEPVRITASIGAVLAEPGDEPSLLLRQADAALYEAKQAGRDQVVVKER